MTKKDFQKFSASNTKMIDRSREITMLFDLDYEPVIPRVRTFWGKFCMRER
jgi:hypothetical protein